METVFFLVLLTLGSCYVIDPKPEEHVINPKGDVVSTLQPHFKSQEELTSDHKSTLRELQSKLKSPVTIILSPPSGPATDRENKILLLNSLSKFVEDLKSQSDSENPSTGEGDEEVHGADGEPHEVNRDEEPGIVSEGKNPDESEIEPSSKETDAPESVDVKNTVLQSEEHPVETAAPENSFPHQNWDCEFHFPPKHLKEDSSRKAYYISFIMN